MPLPTAPEIVLVAASGLARECLELARHSGRTVRGFVDDDESLWGTEILGVPVLGGIGAAAAEADAQLLVCAGKGATRRAIVARLTKTGVAPDRYATLRHPGVTVPMSCTLGAGSILFGGTVLTADVAIAEHVVCMPGVVLTHDCRVADYATLCAGVILGGSVSIEECAYIGMSASVREGTRVGAGATVGMGAVVLGNIPPGEVHAGVPARSIFA